jgi:hypothetical protein
MILMLLPGGKEKEIHFHRLTKVLVDDLQKCWTGVKFGTESVPRRLALLVCCSDGPANRKCMGFVSHSGYMMCPRCLLPCPYDAVHKRCDCSDVSEHPHRTLEGTREAAMQWLAADCPAKREACAHDTGVKYSSFWELETITVSVARLASSHFPWITCWCLTNDYFLHRIRCITYGTALHTSTSGLSLTCIARVRIPPLFYRQGPLRKILEIWEDRDILTTATIKELQARLALTKPPYDIGTCAIVIPVY